MQMTPSSAEARERRAAQLLRDLDLPDVHVSAAGHQEEIAALSVRADEFERLLGGEGIALAAELRALGFRYVALDLEDLGDPDPAAGGAA